MNQKMFDQNKADFGFLPDDKLMAICLLAEAGGEPYEGRVAVGTVILERVDHLHWAGKTIQEVILWPYQFSWTLTSNPERARMLAIAKDVDTFIWTQTPEADALGECLKIAQGLIAGTIPRDPDLAAVNCVQYLNPVTAEETKEKWLASGMKLVKTIHKHEFFA